MTATGDKTTYIYTNIHPHLDYWDKKIGKFGRSIPQMLSEIVNPGVQSANSGAQTPGFPAKQGKKRQFRSEICYVFCAPASEKDERKPQTAVSNR